MPNYQNIREEELKNKVATDYFGDFDTTKIIGNVDFCIIPKFRSQQILFESQSLLWAEAKKGKSNIYTSFVQLILTIGKARTFDKELPPAFLGAFDAFQIAFIPYNQIQEIFYQTDFNWNVTPSNYETKEFKQIHSKVEQILTSQSLIFSFENDEKDLREFIKVNFVIGKSETSKIQIDKNNFIIIYNKWLNEVKPSIIVNWESAKKHGIIDGDFYLADLLSDNNQSLKESLYVLLKGDYYELDKKLDELGFFSSRRSNFNDNQKAHNQFWNRYLRPPREEYWDYIVERRDLLVPQDVRERKGSFFTPQIWVEKSQEYLTDVLGENWQDEYYIWDCAAGTGNLLTGLTNKYNIYASTLDQADVDVMRDRIKTMKENSASGDGSNLLANHVFQFDFLNDSFDDLKVPESLRKILKDPEKRKKLVIYINPPYADSSSNMKAGSKKGNSYNKTQIKYKEKLSNFARELFAQFLIRIYFEISGCLIGEFSKVKLLNVTHAKIMRNHFVASLEKMFIMPADTFDNVKGQFPIGFKIWDTSKKEKFIFIKSDVYRSDGKNMGEKIFYANDDNLKINKWLKKEKTKINGLGFLSMGRNDFQNKNLIFVTNLKENATNYSYPINSSNLMKISIYLAVQNCIKATWLNDRDQFLFPNDSWKTDLEFQNDCLTFTLFHGQNRISSKLGVNNWIPFSENEVNAPERFESSFMTDFVSGKLGEKNNLWDVAIWDQSCFADPDNFIPIKPLEFSKEAEVVFATGRKLWKYYHKEQNCNVNASLYDIKAHFQGQNELGRMNNRSLDEKYNLLINNLRESLDNLGVKIQPKVYEFGFLRG